MSGFLRRLFSGGSGASQTSPGTAGIEYQGYVITAAPEKERGGWRVAGTIAKGTGADRKVHHLIRADTSPDRDAIVAMTIAKAKRLIDEQGEHLFPGG